MVNVDIYRKYENDGYEYLNFCSLSENKIKDIFLWRNHPDIRRYMYNKEEISYESHIRFVKGLKDRIDTYYWLVCRNRNDIGVFNLTKINYENNDAEFGFYVVPNKMNSGMGVYFLSNIISFVFNILNIEYLWGAIDRRNFNAIILDSFIGCRLNENDIENLPNVNFIRWTLNKDVFNKRFYLFHDHRNLIRYMRDNSALIQKISVM